MVFGTGAPMFGLDDDDDYNETADLKERIERLEKEVTELRRQLMLAKNTNMLYENPDYGRSD